MSEVRNLIGIPAGINIQALFGAANRTREPFSEAELGVFDPESILTEIEKRYIEAVIVRESAAYGTMMKIGNNVAGPTDFGIDGETRIDMSSRKFESLEDLIKYIKAVVRNWKEVYIYQITKISSFDAAALKMNPFDIVGKSLLDMSNGSFDRIKIVNDYKIRLAFLNER